MRMSLAIGTTPFVAAITLASSTLVILAPPAFAQEAPDYFTNGAAATTVPANNPYYSNGTAVTAGRTDSANLPYYKDGTSVLAAPADTTSTSPYFTNGASVTSVPLDTATGNGYYNNGAYYKYVPPAPPVAASAPAAPRRIAAPQAREDAAPREPVASTQVTSAPIVLAKPLVHEALEEDVPLQDSVSEESREESDDGPSHWLEPAVAYAPHIIPARVARHALRGLPVESQAGWALLVGGGAIAAVIFASTRKGRRARD